MTESTIITDIIIRHCLRWLGHVARLDDKKMSKQLLFDKLEKRRPRHGIKRRYRDLLTLKDLDAAGIDETYGMRWHRIDWSGLISVG